MYKDPEPTAGWNLPLRIPTSQYHVPLLIASDQRILASTTSHRLAMVPDASLPQNVVCVLQGLPTAYRLRSQDSGNFRIIREAYVHGVMDGEAMHDETREL